MSMSMADETTVRAVYTGFQNIMEHYPLWNLRYAPFFDDNV